MLHTVSHAGTRGDWNYFLPKGLYVLSITRQPKCLLHNGTVFGPIEMIFGTEKRQSDNPTCCFKVTIFKFITSIRIIHSGRNASPYLHS